jgi:hypothetical protein
MRRRRLSHSHPLRTGGREQQRLFPALPECPGDPVLLEEQPTGVLKSGSAAPHGSRRQASWGKIG